MNKKFIAFIIAFSAALVFAIGCCAESGEPYRIYVSPSGSALGDGSQAAPYSSIEQAKKRARLVNGTEAAKHGIEVIFREGTYRLASSVIFDEEDSGTESAPVTYKAYDGEKVKFTAAQIVDSTKFKPVTDENILKRLPEEARGYVYCLSLPEQGIYDYGTIRIMAMNTGSQPSSSLLLVDDSIAVLSGWPNNGSFTKIKEMFPYSGWGYDFSMEEDRIKRWTTAEEPYVYGQFMYDWADDMGGILRMDPKTRRIVTARGFEYGCRAGGEFRVINLLEEIDMPGEYYINREDGTLYYYPKEGTDITKSRFELVTFAESLFVLNKAQYINFENFKAEGTSFSAFALQDSWNNSFRGMEFTNLGAWGVGIVNGRNNIIDRCWFHNMGKGCVRITGANDDRDKLIKCNNIISNNLMESFTEVGKKYVEAIRSFGNGDTITHNRIHDSGHAAINFGGCMQTIEYNDIYDCTTESADAGFVYSGGSCIWNGNVVRYNFIHDGVLEGYWGRTTVYFDDLLTGNYVYGNYMVNVNAALSLHAAKYNTVVNNILLNCHGSGFGSGGTHLGATDESCIEQSERFKQKWENGELTEDYSGSYQNYIRGIMRINNLPNAKDWLEKWPFLSPEVLFGRGRFLAAQGNVLKGNVSISPRSYYLSPLHNTQEKPYPKITGISPVAIECVMENNKEIVDDVSNYVEDAANGNYNLCDEKIIKNLDYELIPDFKLPRLEEIGIEGETNQLEMEDFNILYPRNGQTDIDANDVVLCWENTATAVKYRVVVAKDKEFKNIVLDTIAYQPYYRFRNLSFGETTYYWKVEAISMHWKYKERSRENANGVRCFRTLMYENVDKTLLEDRVRYAEEQYDLSVEGTEPGQSYEGSKAYLKPFIEEAESILAKKSASAKEVDNVLKKLNRAVEFFDSNKNPIQLDIASLFSDQNNWSSKVEGDSIEFTASGGYKGNKIKRHHILAFTLETSKLAGGGWVSFGIRSNTIGQVPWNAEEYIFLVKKDTIELQKFNGSYRFFHETPNKYIFDGKEHKILFSALSETDGVRVTLNVDGTEVFNVLDTENTITTGEMFHVYCGGANAKISSYNR